MSAYRNCDQRGRLPIGIQNSYDLDPAQHLLADHAELTIVGLEHHAESPDVSIYVASPGGHPICWRLLSLAVASPYVDPYQRCHRRDATQQRGALALGLLSKGPEEVGESHDSAA